MPDKNAPTVSFSLPQKDAEGKVAGYKTVHVVVVKHKEDAANKPSVFKTVVLPFGAVLIGAALLIWLALKIKPGKKTDRIINRLEGFGVFFGTDKNEQ